MISNMIVIVAKERTDIGKSSSRRLRLKNRIPAIVYGGKRNPILISIKHNDFLNIQKKRKIFHHPDEIFLSLNKETIHVKVQSIQHHPYKPIYMHIDFIRLIKKIN